MILRRLSQSLKEQNWTAIVIEFVLLVTGVFPGIQVANWNEARREDQRARFFLGRLSSDLDQELASIDKRVAYVGRSITYGEAALTWAEEGKLADNSAWQTVLSFVQASQVRQWITADATYQEMRSSGELGLIRDQALRDGMSRYYAGTASAGYLYAVQPEYRGIVRGLTPQVVTDHIWANCVRTPNRDQQFLLDCDSPVSEAAAQAVLDDYLRDPRLLRELRFWTVNQEVAVLGIKHYKPILADLLARAEAEAGR